MRTFFFVLIVFVAALGGCSAPQAGPSSAAVEPAERERSIHLTATLVSPVNVVLNWRDTDPQVPGHVVEFATEENRDYVILDFLPPKQTSFKHPDLMPETKFFYRVRGFYGPTSAPVTITVPSTLSDKEYTDRYNGSEDYSWAPPKTIPEKRNVVKKSVRSDPTGAAPLDLRAEMKPVTASGFLLTWTDRASDEEGYLLEIRPEGEKDFQVCAVAAPNINSFGWGLTPPMRKAEFRVRAFYYGSPSNIVTEVTGKAPATEPETQPAK